MKKNFFVYKFMKKNFSTWLNTEGLNTKKFTVIMHAGIQI